MIDLELYNLNKECIKTFSEIKIKYLGKNRDMSDLAHNIIQLIKAENKEYENGVRDSGKDNTNQRTIKWHGDRISE